VDFIVSAQQDN